MRTLLIPFLIQSNSAPFHIPSEQLLVILQFLHDNSMRMTSPQIPTEQSIHTLQWNTLSLGYQEKYKYDAACHQRSEEYEKPVSHRLEHLRCETGDQEIEKPVAGGGEGLSECSDVLRKHF